ncbi:MAG: TonB-dependent receptor [Gammaproteobacteria bacterium]|nr:TonB-dependent receptor [Gammaproteobacteria bacterium]
MKHLPNLTALRSSGVAAAIATMLVATPFAQVAAQEQSNKLLEEVIVTATKKETNLQATPIAISALTASQLEARSITDISSLGDALPNVNFQTSNGNTGDSRANIFIRGVGQAEPFIYNDPAVAIYVDGVYIGRSVGAVFNTLSLERVEVLRGPQGTLFGRNTVAGAVSLITKKPNNEFTGFASAEVGNYNTMNLSAGVNIPFSDTVFSSVSLTHRQHDGYIESDAVVPGASLAAGTDYVAGSETEQYDEGVTIGRVALRWEASDNFALDTAIDFTKQRQAPHGQKLAWTGTPTDAMTGQLVKGQYAALGYNYDDYLNDDYQKNSSSYVGHDDQDIAGLNITATWDLDAFTVKSITGYRTLEQSYSGDNDGLPITFNTIFEQKVEQDQTSQEVQFLGNAFDGIFDWLTGAYWYKENATDNIAISSFGMDLPPPLPGVVGNHRDYYDIDIASTAIFAQGSVHLGDWTATLGFRSSQEEKEMKKTIGNLDGTTPHFIYTSPAAPDFVKAAYAPSQNFSGDWSSTTPKVSVDWQMTEDKLLYISYSEGFKSGTFNANTGVAVAASAAIGNSPTVEPEEVNAIEFGGKFQFSDVIRWNWALFDYSYENQQLFAFPVPASPPVLDNVGKSSIQGVESELWWDIASGWALQWSLGYITTEIEEADSSTNAKVGGELPYVPELTSSLGGSYEFNVASNPTSVRADYLYHGEQYNDIQNSEAGKSDGYGVWNLRGTVDLEAWQLWVYVNNVADEKYYDALQFSGDIGIALGSPGAPRTFGTGVRYNF